MKVSIVTTCYNSAATIRETVESVLSQQGDFELEYLITDAGSTDDTLAILAPYEPRLRIVDAKGTNQSQGINLGLRLASGDIVAFLNADDVYEPGAISAVVDAFRAAPEKQWLIGQCTIIDGASEEIQRWVTTYKNLCLRNYAYWLLLIENFVCQPAVFLRREALTTVGFFSESENLVMDYDYWLRIGAQNSPITLKRALARFRRVEGTKSNTSYRQQFRDDMRVAVQAARAHRKSWTIPFKVLSYIRTVGIYSVILR